MTVYFMLSFTAQNGNGILWSKNLRSESPDRKNSRTTNTKRVTMDPEGSVRNCCKSCFVRVTAAAEGRERKKSEGKGM